MMIPDTKARLASAVTELEAFLVRACCYTCQKCFQKVLNAYYRMRCARGCRAPRSSRQRQRHCRARRPCLQTGQAKKTKKSVV